VLAFQEALYDGAKSAKLWGLLRACCKDDLEYQFQASALVAIALAARSGVEEQWNGPLARDVFAAAVTAADRLRRSLEDAQRKLPMTPSGELCQVPEDLLDPATRTMRTEWRQFWGHCSAVALMCASLPEKAAQVEKVWKSWSDARKFNLKKGTEEARLSYFMSRVCIHLEYRFPGAGVAALAGISQELIDLASFDADRHDAAMKYIGRLRT
jgi:hypothetical protein